MVAQNDQHLRGESFSMTIGGEAGVVNGARFDRRRRSLRCLPVDALSDGSLGSRLTLEAFLVDV